jgi:hypothetical protein
MSTKTLDSVAMMRELRERLSQEMAGMSSIERIRYIREKAAATSLGARFQTPPGEPEIGLGVTQAPTPR